MTFISGPSKTADIEATMVHGAHGPREVYIYVITGPEWKVTKVN
jgi:L-lactate dehydrogenase complex protein LldG